MTLSDFTTVTDAYRVAAAERLRGRIANHVPHKDPEWVRAFEEKRKAYRAQIAAWDAIRDGRPDPPEIAEFRAALAQPSKQEWVDQMLEACGNARTAALREAERQPASKTDGSRVEDYAHDETGRVLARERVMAGQSQVMRHAEMAAAGVAGDAGAADFKRFVQERARRGKS